MSKKRPPAPPPPPKAMTIQDRLDSYKQRDQKETSSNIMLWFIIACVAATFIFLVITVVKHS